MKIHTSYSKASIISDEDSFDTLQRVQLRREVTNKGRVVWLTSDRQTTLVEAPNKDEATPLWKSYTPIQVRSHIRGLISPGRLRQRYGARCAGPQVNSNTTD